MTTHYSAAGGVVFDGKGRVLALARPSRDELRLPKGHVEAGETSEEAALREAVEETGYGDLELMHDLGAQTVEFVHEGRHYTRDERYFAFRLSSDRRVERPKKDAKQFTVRWLAADEALILLTYEAEREWVRRALEARALPVVVDG